MVQVRDVQGGCKSIYVDGIFLITVKNPKTLKEWLSKVESHPDPKGWALARRLARKKEQMFWQAVQALTSEAEGLGFHVRKYNSGSSMYLHVSLPPRTTKDVVVVRISNHPPHLVPGQDVLRCDPCPGGMSLEEACIVLRERLDTWIFSSAS